MARRSTPLLSAGVLGVAAWILTSYFQPQTFVAPGPDARLRGGHTSLHAAEEEDLLFQPGQRVTVNGPPAMAGKQGTVVGPILDDAFAIKFDTGSIFNIAIPNIEGSGVAVPHAASVATASPAAPAAAATTTPGDDEELLFQPGQRVTLTGPPAMAGKQGTVLGPKGDDAFAIQFDTGSIFNIDVSNIEGSGTLGTSPAAAASHAAPATTFSSTPASEDDEELLFQPGERVTLTGPPAMAGKQGTVLGPKGDDAFAIQFDTGSIFNIDVSNILGSGTPPAAAASPAAPAAAATAAPGDDEELLFQPGQRVTLSGPPAMAGKQGTVLGPKGDDAFAIQFDTGSIFNIDVYNIEGSGIAAPPSVAARPSFAAPAGFPEPTGSFAAQAVTSAANDEDLEFQPGERVVILAPAAMFGKKAQINGPPVGNAFPVLLESGSIFNIEAANLQTLERPASQSGQKTDYDAVRADLKKVMDDPNWDDGSYGPLLIRLAWHSSGTYSKRTSTGGSEGAAMRFVYGTEAQDPENAGLDHAIKYLQPIKDKYPLMSYSDMWILAAYVAIEHMGGPSIEFKPGRVDTPDESGCPEWDGPAIDGKASSRLPHAEYGLVEGFDRNRVLDNEGRILGWENLAQHMRDVFYRMGFNDREIVALMTGGHLWGRCHPEHSGYAGPWVEYMTKWSNEYAADMIEDPWRMVSHDDTWLDTVGAAELRPAPGKRQYVNKFPPAEGGSGLDDPNQMMLVADMVLLWDPVFRQTLEEYAVDDTGDDDNHALRRDFAAAYKKLTELGTQKLQACPFAHARDMAIAR